MVYKIVIIGAGPAGYHAAMLAAKANLKVLLIEKEKVGGVCLNSGCIPTKTLLYTSKILDIAKEASKYGLNISAANPNLQQILNRKQKIIKVLNTGLLRRLQQQGVEVLIATALSVKREANNFRVETTAGIFNGEKLLIATGSKPFLPSLPGLEQALKNGNAVTSDAALNWLEAPGRLLVIGAGAVGLELASYYNTLGSKVTLIDILPTIGGINEKAVTDVLKNSLSEKGISFYLDSQITHLGLNKLSLLTSSKEEKLSYDKILISTGRKPDFSNLTFVNLDLVIEKDGLKTNKQLRTSYPGVYAAGDVNGISMLAHTAYREAEVCVNDILGNYDEIDYHLIPTVIYTNPEIASVGYTEDTAIKAGFEVKTELISMRYSGRYLAENEGGAGVAKLVACKKTDRLLGFQMVGNYASEIIYGVSLMLQHKMTCKDISKIVIPHPTVAEIVKEAAFPLI